MKRIYIFDTTLRDGTQGSGINFSLEDKIKVVRLLDGFGIDYIEGGWPHSNPKDDAFFNSVRKLKLKHSKIVAFGSTRKKNIPAHKDPNLNAIVKSNAHAACIFGKTWTLHVEKVLRTTLEENLNMIYDSVKFLKKHFDEVIYDAEHFFDGYKENPDYALKTIDAAFRAGATNITLCDTNGGSLPHEVYEITDVVIKKFPGIKLGIHCHNDSGCAVANSIAAVRAGAILVQGTVNGFGERTGNTDILQVIANLEIKMGYRCIGRDKLKKMTELSREIYEIANITPNEKQPYVGYSAFSHKGGVHVAAVERVTKSYEHIDPLVVGNERRILISELAGKASVASKLKLLRKSVPEDKIVTILNEVKRLEQYGYEFENADASFILLVKKLLNEYKSPFEFHGFNINVRKDPLTSAIYSEASVKISVGGVTEHTASEGNGPVDALDRAIKKCLTRFYSELKKVKLIDYRVRVVNSEAGTAAKVRVLITLSDGINEWGTVGVSENIIDASWLALKDAYEYKLIVVR